MDSADCDSAASRSTPAGKPHLFWWGLLLLVLGGLLGAGAVSILRPAPEESAEANGPLPVLGEISDFELLERSGQMVRLQDLAGQVWVADFFFTSCAGICPMMSNQMSRLQEELAGVAGVRLVSISVDPERDTPERLRRYAERYGADPQQWWFLTGEKAAIYKLSRESFRLGVEETKPEDRGPDTEEVLHSSKFVLLDRAGRIRGYYDGDIPDTVPRLARDVRRLLAE